MVLVRSCWLRSTTCILPSFILSSLSVSSLYSLHPHFFSSLFLWRTKMLKPNHHFWRILSFFTPFFFLLASHRISNHHYFSPSTTCRLHNRSNENANESSFEILFWCLLSLKSFPVWITMIWQVLALQLILSSLPSSSNDFCWLRERLTDSMTRWKRSWFRVCFMYEQGIWNKKDTLFDELLFDRKKSWGERRKAQERWIIN